MVVRLHHRFLDKYLFDSTPVSKFKFLTTATDPRTVQVN